MALANQTLDRTLMEETIRTEEAATKGRRTGMAPYLLADSIIRITLHQIDNSLPTSLQVSEELPQMDLEMCQIIGWDRVIDNRDSPPPSP